MKTRWAWAVSMKVFRCLVFPAGFLVVLFGILIAPLPDLVTLGLIGALMVFCLCILPRVGPGGCGCNRGQD